MRVVAAGSAAFAAAVALGCSAILGIEDVPDPSTGGAPSITASTNASTTASIATAVGNASSGTGEPPPRCGLGSTVVGVKRLTFTPAYTNFAGARPARSSASDANVRLHASTNDYGTLLRGHRPLQAEDEPYEVSELRPRLAGALLEQPQEPVAHAGGLYFSAQRQPMGIRQLYWLAHDDGTDDDAQPLEGLPTEESLTFPFAITGADGATLLYHQRNGVFHRMRGQGIDNRTMFAEDATVMISGVTTAVLRPVVAPDESALFYRSGPTTFRAMKADFPVFDGVQAIAVPEEDCSGIAPLWVSADLCSLWVFCYRNQDPGPAIVTLEPAP